MMEVKFLRMVTVAFLLGFLWCQVGRAEGQQEKSTELADTSQEEWLPVPLPLEYSPYKQDDYSETTERPFRRRRIRKRKRRPTTTEPEVYPRKRNRWEDNPELWAQMEEESSRRPSNRRRVSPNFSSEVLEGGKSDTDDIKKVAATIPSLVDLEDGTDEKSKKEKVKIRDPFTALKEEDEKLKKMKVESTTVPLKVKEVLKETTEKKVSLSELLQRKNLSLSELLSGDPQVLSALIENSQENQTSNNINRNFESSENIDNHPNSLEIEPHKITKTSVETTTIQSIKTEHQPANVNLLLVRRKEIVTNRMSLKPRLRLPATKAKPNEDAKNNTNGPLRVNIDLESMLINNITESEQLPEKLKNVTAKEELMEILKDPIGSERLARILELRNMTLEELIQQRERGSSNLHLSDIFHSEKREPEPKEEPLIGKISVFPTVKVIPLKPPSKARSLEFPPKEEAQPSYTVTSFPMYKIEKEKLGLPQFFPVDGLHEGGSESSTYYSTDFAGIEEVQRIEDVENRIAEAVNDRLNVELIEGASSNVHSGVKSAIVASAIIVGASLSVFLAIFVVFKWTQKQRRLNYCDSFTRIRSPILEVADRKRSIKTIMCETLGRRKPYYKQNLQSMSDVSWESDGNKPYQ